MKNTYALLFAFLLSFSASAQLLNGDFEDWSVISDFDDPDTGEQVFVGSNTQSYFEWGLITISEVAGVDGSAMRIETIENETDTIGAFASWGNPPEGEDLVFSDGIPLTDQGITGLNLDVRYDINPDSPGIVLMQFLFEGLPAGPGNSLPGTYVYQLSGEQLTFTNMTFEIDPEIGTMVDEVVVAFTSNNLLDDEATLYPGDFLEVDNISFVTSTDEFPGGNLDSWVPANPVVTPDNFEVFVNPFLEVVEQSTDAAEGEYAMKLTTVFGDDEAIPAYAVQGEINDDGLNPSIYTGDDFYGFSFQYKYNVLTEDSAIVFIGFSETENPMPSDIIYQLYPLGPEDDYTTVEVDLSDIIALNPLNYFSVVIASSFDNSENGGNIPFAGSQLWIDDFQFLYDGEGCPFNEEIEQGSSLILCAEETVSINVAEGYDAYQWYKQPTFGGDAEAIMGATSNELEVDYADFTLFTVWCEITQDECTESSSTMDIDGYVFVPTTVQSTVTTICEGETTTLEALGAEGEVVWYLDGEEIMGETDNVIEVSEPGMYVASIFPSVCPNLELSSGVGPTITVNPLPTPDVTLDEETGMLSTDMYESYQWYFDGEPIADSGNSQEHDPSDNGEYYVEVIDIFGCVGTSEIIVVDFLFSVEENGKNLIKVYPNPSTDEIQISSLERGLVSIYDLDGRIVITEQKTTDLHTISLESIASGTYILNLNLNTVRVVKF